MSDAPVEFEKQNMRRGFRNFHEFPRKLRHSRCKICSYDEDSMAYTGVHPGLRLRLVVRNRCNGPDRDSGKSLTGQALTNLVKAPDHDWNPLDAQNMFHLDVHHVDRNLPPSPRISEHSSAKALPVCAPRGMHAVF